jgi:hypothetical protein
MRDSNLAAFGRAFIVAFAAVAIWISCGGCSAPVEPVEEVIGAPAWVGHYSSMTDRYDVVVESGDTIPVLVSSQFTINEDGSCRVHVALTDPASGGDVVTITTTRCEYRIQTDNAVLFDGAATYLYGDGTSRPGSVWFFGYGAEDWSTVSWYPFTGYDAQVLERTT